MRMTRKEKKLKISKVISLTGRGGNAVGLPKTRTRPKDYKGSQISTKEVSKISRKGQKT